MIPNSVLEMLRESVTIAEKSDDPVSREAAFASMLDLFKQLDEHVSKGGFLPDGWRRPIISCPQCGGDMTGNRMPDGTCAGHLVSPPGVPLVMCEGKGQPATVLKFHAVAPAERYAVREVSDGWDVVRLADQVAIVWYSNADPDCHGMAERLCASLNGRPVPGIYPHHND